MPALHREANSVDVVESLDAKRAATGDEAAFERLYRRHVARIHTMVRRMAGPDLAEELTQDVFVRAWDKLGTFRGESAFGTWLYRLGVNVVLSKRRSDKNDRTWILDDELAMARVPRRQRPTRRREWISESAIARLPDGARKVFRVARRYGRGGRTRRLPSRWAWCPGTSKSQLSRARAALRRMLDGH